ncbi:AtpZ/AtpI family protein [Rhodoblastus sp.]|uniref:AtpZ/AtpI family protein n=1 Tax=Rhodoblastus sp. TaxID=1962975 RepID=UPI0026062F8A|nr:AtpZ/AtpI family protein [Rhodoblastus sp.]
MGGQSENHDANDPLVRAARRGAERDKRGAAESEPSVIRRLAQIGVLGWVIVTPTLLGVFIGRWLDRVTHSQLFWTAPLLLIGFALGVWSAWKWVEKA